jgi:hypothetical protein
MEALQRIGCFLSRRARNREPLIGRANIECLFLVDVEEL